jgi:hypothetical protein
VSVFSSRAAPRFELARSAAGFSAQNQDVFAIPRCAPDAIVAKCVRGE